MTLTAGQLAKHAGVNLATIRYYERRGLLPPPPRTAAGYRAYSEDSVRRLRFIRHAQALGFTLKEVSDLLGMTAKKRSSAEVCDLARRKIFDIEDRITLLRALKKRLERLTTACDGRGTVDDCVIIRELYA